MKLMKIRTEYFIIFCWSLFMLGTGMVINDLSNKETKIEKQIEQTKSQIDTVYGGNMMIIYHHYDKKEK